MPGPIRRIIPAVRSLLAGRAEADRALLDRFVRGQDEGAFGELMGRHGPMVLGVARRVARHAQDAEDVFQATFLLLARKARSIRRPDALGAWLHQSAFRLALRARRRHPPPEARPPRQAPDPLDALTARELLAALDEELARLPDEQRAAVVLCGLEGLSLEEAARRLGWSAGSVKGRLERGRARLRRRLEERGLSLPAAFVGPLVGGGPPPGALLHSARAAVLKGEVGPSVLALVEGGVPAMTMTKLSLVGAVLLLCGVLGLATVLPGDRPPPKADAPPPADTKGEPLPAGALLRLGEMERRAVDAKVVVTADGESIVAISRDTKRITEWDFRTGKLRERRPLPIDWPSLARELSPDGRWLVTTEEGKTQPEQNAVVWDVRTGKPVRKLPFKGSRNMNQLAAFSPDGRRLALPLHVGEGKRRIQVHVWDWKRGDELFVGEVIGNDSIGQIAFSADGNCVLVTLRADNYGIHCWDVTARKKLWSNTPARTEQMVVLPQGKVLSLEGRGLVERDLRTGARTATLRLPPCDTDHRVEAMPRGDKLLISGREGVVIWNLEHGRRSLTIPGPWAQVTPAHDGKSLVTNIGALQRWDLTTGKPLYADESLKGHVGEVRALVYSADGSRLISGAADGSIAVWDLRTGKPIRLWRQHEPIRRSRRWMHPRGGVIALDATPDGQRIFSAGEVDGFHLWDVPAGKEIGSFERPEPLNPSYGYETTHSLRLSRDGRTALALLCPGSGGFGKEVTGRLFRWDFASGKGTTVCPVERLVFWTSGVGPEGRWFANAGRVFDARTGQGMTKLEEYDPQGQADVTFSPGGLLIAGGETWRADNTPPARKPPSIHVWEATTGKVVGRLLGVRQPGEKVFHPSGRYLAYNQLSSVRLLDLRSEKEVKSWEMPAGLALEGYGYRVSCFAFSPDGRTLATGHPDGSILLWDADLPAEKPAAARPGEPEALWAQLGDEDARKAYQAAWRLSELPREAAELLGKKLRPARPAAAEVTAKLVAALDADTQAERDEASRRLGELGASAEPALREALKAPASVEQRRRLERLLASSSAPSPQQLRDLRGVMVLTWLGTPEARKVLRSLAEGVAADLVTQQARAALARRP